MAAMPASLTKSSLLHYYLDALQQITGTCKTPESRTSCLEWAFVSGSKLTTGSGMTRSASGLWRDFRGLPTRYNHHHYG